MPKKRYSVTRDQLAKQDKIDIAAKMLSNVGRNIFDTLSFFNTEDEVAATISSGAMAVVAAGIGASEAAAEWVSFN